MVRWGSPVQARQVALPKGWNVFFWEKKWNLTRNGEKRKFFTRHFPNFRLRPIISSKKYRNPLKRQVIKSIPQENDEKIFSIFLKCVILFREHKANVVHPMESWLRFFATSFLLTRNDCEYESLLRIDVCYLRFLTGHFSFYGIDA